MSTLIILTFMIIIDKCHQIYRYCTFLDKTNDFSVLFSGQTEVGAFTPNTSLGQLLI